MNKFKNLDKIFMVLGFVVVLVIICFVIRAPIVQKPLKVDTPAGVEKTDLKPAIIEDFGKDGYKRFENPKYGYAVEFPENYDTGSKPLKEPELGESSLITFHGPRLGYSYPGDHIRTYARKIDRPLNQATLDALMKDMTSLLGGVYETYTTFCDPQENRQILIKSSPTLVYETYFKQFVSGTKEFVKEVGPLYLVLSGNENSKETRAFIILGGTSEVAKEMALSVTFE